MITIDCPKCHKTYDFENEYKKLERIDDVTDSRKCIICGTIFTYIKILKSDTENVRFGIDLDLINSH